MSSNLNYDIALDGDILTLVLFKQKKPPHDPQFFFYPQLNTALIERSALDKHEIKLLPETTELLSKHKYILVTEVDKQGNEDEMISYNLEIQVMEFIDKDKE